MRNKGKWGRESIDAAVEAGRDYAQIKGRTHSTKIIGTTDTMVVLKEINGTVRLTPFHHIIDMYAAEGVPA